ncbi:MAG: histidine kinase [Crocinitomicaceae bacterium]|nr:histidine kinase [Crocinitomicaceae bacterium]
MYLKGDLNYMRTYLLFIACFLFSSICWSQLLEGSDSYIQEKIDVSSGMPSNEVYHVVQDQNNYLWFATDNGIVKYDGTKLKVYTANDGLPENVVFRFYPQKDGRIYGETIGNKYFYIENDSIVPFKYSNIIQAKFSRYRMYSFYIDSSENYHFGGKAVELVLSNQGEILYECTPVFDSEVVYILNLKEQDDYVFTSVSYESQGGDRIVHRDRNEVYENVVRGKLYNLYGERSATKVNNKVVAVTYGDRAIVLKEGRIIQELCKGQEVLDIQKVGRRIWVSTAREGAVSYDILGDSLTNKKKYLNGLSITSVLEDHEGGLWFTTREEGVVHMHQFEVSRYYRSNIASNISAFYKNDKYCLIGYENGQMVDAHAGKVVLKITKYFRDILPWSEGVIFPLIGTERQILYSLRDQKEIPFLDKNDSLHSFPVSGQYYLLGDRNIVHYSYCVGSVNKETNEFTKLFSDHEIKESIQKIVVVGNLIWAVTKKSLLQLNIRSRSIELKLPISATPVMIKRYGKTCMIACRNGDVYVLEGDKLVKQEFLEINKDSRLYDIELYGDQLIVAGNTGIKKYKLHARLNKWIRTSFFGLNGVVKIYNYGDELFYMTKKEVYLDRNVNAKPIIPIVRLKRVKVNDAIVPLDEKACFSYDRNNVSFDLNSISFGADFLQYRFKLKGRDEKYRFTSDHKLTYSALLPGEYELLVSSTTNGLDYSAVKHFTFVIEPPFWKTTWFMVLVVLSLIISVILLYRNQMKKYKAKHLMRETINELKSKALAAQLNPHLIFNVMNSIQATIAEQETEKANIYLSRFAQFMRMTLNVSKQISISFRKEMNLTEQYIELEMLRFPSGLEINIDLDEKCFNWEVPPLILQPYIENAIKHGIMPVEMDDGQIEISAQEESGCFTIQIIDNGIGLDENESFKEGDGMRISRERIQLLNANNTVEVLKREKGTMIQIQLFTPDV